MIRKEKIGWLAGIIEGEGCIMIGKSHRTENGKLRYNFQIKLDNTNPLMVLEFHRLLGGCLFEVKANGLGNRRVYRWCISGVKKVIPFIKLIRPFMVTKTEQADIIIKYAKEFSIRRHDRNEIREIAYKAMRFANHRTILSETFPEKELDVQRLDGNPSQEVKVKSELIGNYEREPEAVSRLN